MVPATGDIGADLAAGFFDSPDINGLYADQFLRLIGNVRRKPCLRLAVQQVRTARRYKMANKFIDDKEDKS